MLIMTENLLKEECKISIHISSSIFNAHTLTLKSASRKQSKSFKVTGKAHTTVVHSVSNFAKD